MPTHYDFRWAEMDAAMEGTKALRNLAAKYGISDPFVDNGVKVLQIAVATGLDIMPGRQGADAADRVDNEYEIKTMDTLKSVRGFTTNHHLTASTIAKYRQRRFVFATYENSVLQAAYLVEPEDMEPIYRKWEGQLRGRSHLNNPKIALEYVIETGRVLYMKDVAAPWTPKTRASEARAGA